MLTFDGVEVGEIDLNTLDNTELHVLEEREALLVAFERGFNLALQGYTYTINEKRDEIILVKTPR